jgi:CubicO group peptidase (beta-lactamase class C family)
VVRDRKLVFERYYEGQDQKWGYPLGKVTFTPDTLHDLQSITKSVVSLLYGIALGEGMVPEIETPLVEAIPEYTEIYNHPVRRRITVKHALTMTMGLEWNEDDYPFGDPRNSWTQMNRARDQVWHAFGMPVEAEPGTKWIYSSGATVILARLISNGVGKSLLEYAREKLFIPLSINDVSWTNANGSDGMEAAGGGLRMKPRDLAKIGQLILNQGRWNDVQLVPFEWLVASFVEKPTDNEKYQYGYQWWLGRLQESDGLWVDGVGPDRWIGGLGYGNQGLIVIPAYQLVVVINAGNYGRQETKLISRIVLEYVLPAMVR